VPGLSGKAVIDILILVDDVAIADRFSEKMEFVGYRALGEYVMPDARLFVRDADGIRLSNVHVFPKDHPHVNAMLGLRAYLRSHPERVKEYSKLKFDLFKKHPNDYGQYRKHKDAWMKKLQAKI